MELALACITEEELGPSIIWVSSGSQFFSQNGIGCCSGGRPIWSLETSVPCSQIVINVLGIGFRHVGQGRLQGDEGSWRWSSSSLYLCLLPCQNTNHPSKNPGLLTVAPVGVKGLLLAGEFA